MTKVVFFKSNGAFWGFEEQGHSGFASSGDDVLCSAISAMTMLVINAIEVAYSSEADYDIDEETAMVRLIARGALPNYEKDEKKRYAISGLIMAYYYQLNDLVEEYYDYLEVEVIDKEYEGNK
ncbi:MAG: ribosomal-processing cysteine protease Prp [Clostridia bacterium]|nr:ribosomal-processing cysteine protease Prp [Clostridia bacterium]